MYQSYRPELRSCVKIQVAVLGSPSLIVLMVFVEVKLHWTWTQWREAELRRCVKSWGCRPGFPVPNGPYCPCERKATFNLNTFVPLANLGLAVLYLDALLKGAAAHKERLPVSDRVPVSDDTAVTGQESQTFNNIVLLNASHIIPV